MRKIRHAMRRAWEAFKNFIRDPGLDVMAGGTAASSLSLAVVGGYAAGVAFAAGQIFTGAVIICAVLFALMIAYHTVLRLIVDIKLDTFAMSVNQVFRKVPVPA